MMSPLATLIVLALAAGLWFGVLRPRLRGGSKPGGGDEGGTPSDGSRDRPHDEGDDGGDGDSGDGGGGD